MPNRLPRILQGSSVDDLCAVVYDVTARKRARVLPRPVFTVSPDGALATSIDFIRLQKVRKGMQSVISACNYCVAREFTFWLQPARELAQPGIQWHCVLPHLRSCDGLHVPRAALPRIASRLLWSALRCRIWLRVQPAGAAQACRRQMPSQRWPVAGGRPHRRARWLVSVLCC